jgi:hypothetical protein
MIAFCSVARLPLSRALALLLHPVWIVCTLTPLPLAVPDRLYAMLL